MAASLFGKACCGEKHADVTSLMINNLKLALPFRVSERLEVFGTAEPVRPIEQFWALYLNSKAASIFQLYPSIPGYANMKLAVEGSYFKVEQVA